MTGEFTMSGRDASPVILLRAELYVFELNTAPRPEEALARGLELERLAADLAHEELVMRARLVQANALEGLGQLAESLRLNMGVHEWASRTGDASVLAYSHMVLSLTHREIGDQAAYLEHAIAGIETLGDEAPAELRLRHLIRLANAHAQTGSIEAARERYEQAIALAATLGDEGERWRAVNNLAYAEYEAGNVERAWMTLQPLLAQRDAVDADADLLDTIARIQLGRGEYVEAHQSAQACIAADEASDSEEAEALPEFLLTLAATQRHLDLLDDAQESLDRSSALCVERDLGWTAARVQQEQAALHAARGDFARAYDLHVAFHTVEKVLVAEERQAQARLRQVVFETREARQDAARFREQARTDALTGLPNRRFVDEQFPVLLHAVNSADQTVIAALLDIDHFKRINDTCSHDVGDKVLAAVAAVLATEVPEGGFVARMGGEEFLVVLTDLAPAEAIARRESLRRTVAANPWDALTGGLPVTVSIGVTMVDRDADQAGVLARADEQLYAAKRGGRNRISVDPAMRGSRRSYRNGH